MSRRHVLVDLAYMTVTNTLIYCLFISDLRDKFGIVCSCQAANLC